MKKKIFITSLLLFVLFLPMFLVGCAQNVTTLTNYTLNLTFDDSSYTLKGEEEICYYNNNDNMFTFLMFHLYPNAYRENAKNSIVNQTNLEKAYPNGESYGYIEINTVKVEDQETTFEVIGQDENILKIDLLCELYPEEKINIFIEFQVKLANINHRLGYGENTINFGNFYPIVCVYEEGEGFYQDLYHSNGDPFYSECSNYDVTLSYPSIYQIASTGDINKTETTNNLTKINIKSEKTRDFAFVLSEKFEKISQKLNNTTINYYGYKQDENLEESLKTCIDSVKTFNDLFGSYPYKTLNVVKSNFVYGGMEYPNLVLIGDDIAFQKDYNYVIVHEIAHQWWYGVVGNDEYNHAWQDEGLTEFSTMLFYKINKNYDENFENLVKNCLQSYKLFEKVYINITGEVDGRMDRPINEFATEPEYVQCTYTKGVLMYNSIMDTVGEKKFIKALKDYYNKFSYSIAKPEDMIASFNKSTGYNLEGFIYSWLNGKIVIQ